MIQGKYLNCNDDLSKIIDIRKKVFVNELGLYETVDQNIKDDISINVIVNDGKRDVGTGRITLENFEFSIDMVCVLKEHRNNGFGEFIVRLLADKALLAGADYISINATSDTVPFFEKLYFNVLENIYSTDLFTPMLLNLSNFKSRCGHNCKK